MRKVFDEHWHAYNCGLVFVLSVITVIVAVIPKDGSFFNNVGGTILISGLITGFVGGALCGVVKGLTEDCSYNKRLYLRAGFSFLLIMLVVTALLLGKLLFITENTYVHSEPVGGKSVTVYTTDTGDCYHRSYCGYLKSKHQTTQFEAELNGYEPCSACFNGVGLTRHDVTTTNQEHHYGNAFIVSFLFWGSVYALTAWRIIKHREKERQKKHRIRLDYRVWVIIVSCIIGYGISTLILIFVPASRISIFWMGYFPIAWLVAAIVDKGLELEGITILWVSAPAILLIVVWRIVASVNESISMDVFLHSIPFSIVTSIVLFEYRVLYHRTQ